MGDVWTVVRILGTGRAVDLSDHKTMGEASAARAQADIDTPGYPHLVRRPKGSPAPITVDVPPDYPRTTRRTPQRARQTALTRTLTTAQTAALHDYLVECSLASRTPTIVGARAATACLLAEDVFAARLRTFAENRRTI